MSNICIIIPDKSFRAAVDEAIQAAGFGATENSDALDAFLNKTDATVLVVDETAADKGLLKALNEASATIKNRRILLLGEPPHHFADEANMETFPKPLRLGHLLTRVAFHLRTRSRLQNNSVSVGVWRIELQSRQIVRETDQALIRLTEKETALLDYLLDANRPVGREELLAAVWGHDGRIDTHTLETHIYQLRRKLDPEGKGTDLLVNELGSYRLNLA